MPISIAIFGIVDHPLTQVTYETQLATLYKQDTADCQLSSLCAVVCELLSTADLQVVVISYLKW